MHRPSLVLASAIAWAPLASAQVVSTESLDLRGAVNSVDDGDAAISDDGRFLAFVSPDGWFANDSNGKDDVFHRDRLTGAVRKCSVDANGGPANGASTTPAISADGRLVAFSSSASNLVLGDNNAKTDVFLYDTWLQSIELVSIALNGGSGNSWSGSSTPLSISADGRFVAFSSRAWNLVAGFGTDDYQMYVRDRVLGTTECASAVPAIGDVGIGQRGTISRDGRFVSYLGLSGAMTPSLQPGTSGVFVHDRTTGQSELVSVGTAGQIALGYFGEPVMSASARYVLFSTNATNLDPLDTETYPDWYLRDRVAGTTRVVTETLQDIATSFFVEPPDDGSAVVYTTDSNQWMWNDYNASNDVYRRDLATGQVTLLSRAYATSTAVGKTFAGDATPDGRFVTLRSYETALGFGPIGVQSDVYVLDAAPQNVAASAFYCSTPANSAGCQPAIALAGEPSVAGPGSAWVTASSMMNASPGLLIWSLSPASLPYFGSTLCVGAPRHRTYLQPSGGSAPPVLDCSGTYSFHFGPAYIAQLGLQSGARIHAQYYQRDPGLPPPNNLSLTRGVAFDLVP